MSIKHIKHHGGVSKLIQDVERAAKGRVLVGYPSGGKERRGAPVTNALLGAIHELGSESRGIPARPFLRPGVRYGTPKYSKIIKLHYRDPTLQDKLGVTASSSVKEYMVSSQFRSSVPPLASRTLAGRRKKRPGGDPSLGHHPLVDSGQLRQSVTYVIART